MQARLCDFGDSTVLQQTKAEVLYLRSLVAGSKIPDDRLQQLEGENRSLRQQLALAEAKQEALQALQCSPNSGASGPQWLSGTFPARRLRRTSSEPVWSSIDPWLGEPACDRDLWSTPRAAATLAPTSGCHATTRHAEAALDCSSQLRCRSLGSQIASRMRDDQSRTADFPIESHDVLSRAPPREPSRPSSPPRRAAAVRETPSYEPRPALPTLGGTSPAPLFGISAPATPRPARPTSATYSSAARAVRPLEHPGRPLPRDASCHGPGCTVQGVPEHSLRAAPVPVRPEMCCPQGHKLVSVGSAQRPILPAAASLAYSEWNCDADCSAGSARTPGLGRFHCASCQHDVCERCYAAFRGLEVQARLPLPCKPSGAKRGAGLTARGRGTASGNGPANDARHQQWTEPTKGSQRSTSLDRARSFATTTSTACSTNPSRVTPMSWQDQAKLPDVKRIVLVNGPNSARASQSYAEVRASGWMQSSQPALSAARPGFPGRDLEASRRPMLPSVR